MHKKTLYLRIVISFGMATFKVQALFCLFFLWLEASGQPQLAIKYDLPRTPENVGSLCAAQMEAFLEGLINFDLWAITMFDASSKIPVGLLRGNIYDFGNYDECIAIEEERQNFTIKGKYCWSAVQIPLPTISLSYTKKDQLLKIFRLLASKMDYNVDLALSLCIPDACKPTEVAEYLDIAEGALFNDQLCQTNEAQSLDASDIVATIFFSIILFLMVVSTMYDVYLYKTSRAPAHQICLAFSVFMNGRKLLAVNNDDKKQLTSLYGLRCISMIWIVYGHRFSVFGNIPAVNMIDIAEWPSKLYTQYIQAAPISVDTFFFLSGMMISYGYFNMKVKPKGLSFIPKYYLHRYLRITPAVAALFFVVVTIWRHLGSGPIWPAVAGFRRDSCLTWWWSYFLYVQNYVNSHDLCVITTWYLSADMQLFLLSPFILLPIGYISEKKSKKITYGACACSVLAFMLIQIVIRLNVKSVNSQMTHERVSNWMMGFTAGIFLKEVKSGDLKIKMTSKVNLAIWAAVLAGMISIVLTMHDVYQNPEELKTNMFETFHRPAWGIGLAWIIYSCTTGYGGFVNWFLSLPVFQVLSRLTYSMYLVHIFVIFFSAGVMRMPWHFTNYNAFYGFCGDIICTTIVAAIWVLAFESPVITIEKCIFNRSSG